MVFCLIGYSDVHRVGSSRECFLQRSLAICSCFSFLCSFRTRLRQPPPPARAITPDDRRMADSLAKILPFSIMSQIWAQFANTRLISRQQMAPTISNSVKLGYFHTGCRVVDNRQVNVLVQDFTTRWRLSKIQFYF